MKQTERSQRLVQWFRSNGGYFLEDIDLVESNLYGLHAEASRSLSSPTKVCVCPTKLTISHLNVVGTNPELGSKLGIRLVDGTAAKLVGHVENHIVTYFFLVEQRLLGEKSFWHEYIQCLPTEAHLSTPLFFNDEELRWILGTNLHSSASDIRRSALEQRRAQWKQEWRQGCDVLIAQGMNATDYTWTSFLWAATIFSSRCFSSAVTMNYQPSFSILYPVLDSLNHKFGAKVAWSFENGSFELDLEEDIPEGNQVYNNYAPKGNEELLLGYGFVLENNPCDEVMVRLGKPPDPVLSILQTSFPQHFTSPWDPSQGTFFLRSPNHYSSGYDHGIPCLRGIPQEMFHMIAEMAYFVSTGDTTGAGEIAVGSEQFAIVIDEFLIPLNHKLQMIEAPAMALTREPLNAKERAGKIYRDGQAEILRYIIKEMEDYLNEHGSSEGLDTDP